MFNMFLNMFWRAEDFGYMCVPFELWSFNNLCLKQKQILDACGQHKAGVCFCFLSVYKRSKKLETRQIFLVIFCLKKDQFWFLLLLRTSSAEVWQKKLCTETQIAQPPRQLQEWLWWQMKDIYCYIFVIRLQCEFSFIVGVRVA